MGTLNGNGTSAATPQERLQMRLADPHTVDAINALLDKLDVAVFSLNALDGFLRRGEEVADSLRDSVADLKKMAPAEGSDGAQLIGKLPQLARAGVQVADATASPAFTNLVQSGLLEQLGKPETIATIKALLDRLELATFILNALDGFIRRGDEITEAAADSVAELRKLSPTLPEVNVGELVKAAPKLAEAGQHLAQSGLVDELPKISQAGVALAQSGMLEKFPELTRSLIQLVDSGIFDRKTVDVLANAGKTLADSYGDSVAAPAQPVGIGGLLKALGDPDIQRALGLFLTFAKRFGQTLK